RGGRRIARGVLTRTAPRRAHRPESRTASYRGGSAGMVACHLSARDSWSPALGGGERREPGPRAQSRSPTLPPETDSFQNETSVSSRKSRYRGGAEARRWQGARPRYSQRLRRRERNAASGDGSAARRCRDFRDETLVGMSRGFAERETGERSHRRVLVCI